MHPDRLAATLRTLRWSVMDAAAATGWNERTIRRWLAGEYAIPDDIEHWLERMSAVFAEMPPPHKRKNISR